MEFDDKQPTGMPARENVYGNGNGMINVNLYSAIVTKSLMR